MVRIAARIRRPLVIIGILITLGSIIWAFAGPAVFGSGKTGPWASLVAAACIILGVVLTILSPIPDEEPLPLASPVRGDWTAVNSPSSKVPSHGTHGYGQTFAVDLLLESDSDALKPDAKNTDAKKAGSGFQPPSDFLSFGQPLYAPAPAIVVRVYDRAWDHRSRTSPWALAYFYLESVVRDFLGANRIVGNHVVLRLEDGTHFVFAHLRRGSVRVSPGQTIALGEVIAECGNSGNSTQPHLHCQRQDIASISRAAGLPWTIHPGGIPENLESLSTAEEPGQASSGA